MVNTLDLAIIGGGVSATSVLESLLPQLAQPARIAVIDRSGDFGGGVPYGRAVQPYFLCNNPVEAQHDASLREWLTARRGEWLGCVTESKDPLLRRWCDCNAEVLGAEEYERLFIPRSVYGDFLREKMARIRAAGVELIPDEVVSIGPGFALTLRRGAKLAARQVLVAMGHPSASLEAIHPYSIDPETLAGYDEVFLLGANASAMEMIWLIHGHARHIRQVTVIAGGGRLPDARRSGLPGHPAMRALASLSDLSAKTLAAAAETDVHNALVAGYTTLDVSSPLFEHFMPLFDALSPEERQIFVERYGRRFKALNRRTPPEYRDAADALCRRGVLSIVEATLQAEDVARLKSVRPNALVLDCRGWKELEATSEPLLRALLDQRLAQINRSHLGLVVDEELALSPGLFVAGPLLAGVSTAKHTYWNLESAKRLFAMAPAIARTVALRMRKGSHVSPAA